MLQPYRFRGQGVATAAQVLSVHAAASGMLGNLALPSIVKHLLCKKTLSLRKMTANGFTTLACKVLVARQG